MSVYTHREIEDLLGAFALDAVDEDERDVVEAHLVGCPRCRNEVITHRETVVLLANDGADAPEGLWNRISDSLDEVPPELDLARIIPFDAAARQALRPSPDRRSVSVRATVAMVAVAAGLFAFVGVRVGDQDQKIDDIAAQMTVGAALDKAFTIASSEPTAENVALEAPDGEGGARVVRLRDGSGFVSADTLRPLPADRTYQLWALRGDKRISLGVLGNDPRTSSFRMVGELDGFAITDEAAPGVDATTADPVAVGLVS